MGEEMSDNIVIKTLGRELINVGDDLYRAECTLKTNPDWRSGNGETIQEVVAGYQRQWDELRAAIVAERGKLR